VKVDPVNISYNDGWLAKNYKAVLAGGMMAWCLMHS
jgi:hypothetical protein